MNIKRWLSLAIIISVSAFVAAQQRSLSEAADVAARFGGSNKSASEVALSHTAKWGEVPLYYVFNRAEGGFVIVSGDSRARDVLAYSFEGSFCADSLIDTQRAWLEGYAAEMKSISMSSIAQPSAQKANKASAAAEAVAPLLGKIVWGQGSPFNDLCPKFNAGRAPSGCVATATAQIMYSYRWPVGNCVGSNSYTFQSEDGVREYLSADFSKVSFDWDKMVPNYQGVSDKTARSEAAKLLYNVGISVDMDYGTAGSGSHNRSAMQALTENFRYANTMTRAQRKYHTYAEWVAMLKAELLAGRPMLYAGYGSDGGHSFVCDGFDANGLFHFNWGWDGYCNGYYALSTLNPGEPDATLSNAGFASGQEAVLGITKDKLTDDAQLYYESMSVSSKGTEYELTINNMLNESTVKFDGKLIMQALDADGNVAYQFPADSYTINPYSATYGSHTFTMPATVGLPDGSYTLVLVCQDATDASPRATHGKVNAANTVKLTVANGKATYARISPKVDLEVTSLLESGEIVSSGGMASLASPIDITIKNNGDDYVSKIWLKLSGGSKFESKQYLMPLGHGETVSVVLCESINLTPGTYTLTVYADKNNNPNQNEFNLMNTLTLLSKKVQVVAYKAPSLYAAGNVQLLSASAESVRLSAPIGNKGGKSLGNELCAFIFPAEGSQSVAVSTSYKAYIDNGKTENVVFEFDNLQLADGEYFVGGVSEWVSGQWVDLPNEGGFKVYAPFTIDASPVSGLTADACKVYPNPVRDVLTVANAEGVEAVEIYTLAGAKLMSEPAFGSPVLTISVAHLPQGVYMLVCRTASGSAVTRTIIKQ